MVLPLVPIGVGAVTALAALFGVNKGLSAKEKMDKTQKLNVEIKQIIKRNQEVIKIKREQTANALEALGEDKYLIQATSMDNFLTHYGKLKKVNFKNINCNVLYDFEPQGLIMGSVIKGTVTAKKILVNGIEAVGSGVLMSAAACGSVMYGGFAAASTGTMIGSLSGAAATNATLAWLGGGSLAAGGFGMAGGIAVLGGIVAGPALLVGGWLLDSEAEEKMYKALEARDKALEYDADAKKIVSGLDAIYQRSNQVRTLLRDLNNVFEQQIQKLIDIIAVCGTDYSVYTNNNRDVVRICALLAKTIYTVMKVPLLTDKGSLTLESRDMVSSLQFLPTSSVVLENQLTSFLNENTPEQNIEERQKIIDPEVDALRQRAENGDTYAQWTLGYRYEKGIGVEKNIKESQYWYDLSKKSK